MFLKEVCSEMIFFRKVRLEFGTGPQWWEAVKQLLCTSLSEIVKLSAQTSSGIPALGSGKFQQTEELHFKYFNKMNNAQQTLQWCFHSS